MTSPLGTTAPGAGRRRPRAHAHDDAPRLSLDGAWDFRLLGQEISEREYIRPGDYVHELDGEHGTESLEPHYRDCLQRRIWLRHADLAWSDPRKSFVRYDILLLPLARDGRDIDSMIGLVVYDS